MVKLGKLKIFNLIKYIYFNFIIKRCLKEFSKLNYSAFIYLRNINESGYPYRSNIADLFLYSMSSFLHAEVMLLSLVKSIIDFVNEIKEKNSSFSDQQIAEEFSKHQPWCNGFQEKTEKFQNFLS